MHATMVDGIYCVAVEQEQATTNGWKLAEDEYFSGWNKQVKNDLEQNLQYH